MPPGLRPTSDNRNRHLLDVTAAYLDLRRYAAASDVLSRLAAQAPAWLVAQPTAASLMSQIITRRLAADPADARAGRDDALASLTSGYGTSGRCPCKCH